jgi:hypothetical protein
MNSTHTILLTLLVLLGVGTSSALAGVVPGLTSTAAAWEESRTGDNGGQQVVKGTSSASASFRGGSAQASTGHGSNKVFAEGDATGTPNWRSGGSATSMWCDTFTVSASGSGYIQIRLTGTLSKSGYSFSVVQWDWDAGEGAYERDTPLEERSGTGTGIVYETFLIPYTFTGGEAFLIQARLATGPVHAWGWLDGNFAQTDLSSTAVVTNIVIPEGATLMTSSGFDYPVSHAILDPSPGAASCRGAILKALSSYCMASASASSKNLKKPDATKFGARLGKAEGKLRARWDKAEAKAVKKGLTVDVFDTDTTLDVIADEDLGMDGILDEITGNVSDLNTEDGARLASDLMKAVGKCCRRMLKAEYKHARKADSEKRDSAQAKAATKFQASWDKAIAKASNNDTTYAGDMAIVKGMIDTMLEDILGSL